MQTKSTLSLSSDLRNGKLPLMKTVPSSESVLTSGIESIANNL